MKFQFMLVAMAISSMLCPGSVFAKDATVKTVEDIAVTYALNATEKIARVKGYAETTKPNITIPSKIKVGGVTYTVTKIGAAAFKNADFRTVNLPNTITFIDKEAFDGSWLKVFSMPSKVEQIGDFAFRGTLIQQIAIPSSCTKIGRSAFEGCPMTRLFFDASSKPLTIGVEAFAHTDIRDAQMPDRIVSLGDGAFAKCSELESVRWPSGLASVPARCFYWCASLKTVGLPEGVTAIGDFAYCNIYGMTTLSLPKSLRTIGRETFSNVGITILDVPEGVTSIGESAFAGCTNLLDIALPSTLRSLGPTCFQGSDAVRLVRCDAMTPPVCGTNPFSTKTFYNAKIEVPEQVWRVYSYADWWWNFDYSRYSTPSGINNVRDDASGTECVEYYDLRGHRLAEPVKGQVHIRVTRCKDGTELTEKIYR